jgi:hypothetical protein
MRIFAVVPKKHESHAYALSLRKIDPEPDMSFVLFRYIKR